MAENNQTEEKKKSKLGLIIFIAVFFFGIVFLIYWLLKPSKPDFRPKGDTAGTRTSHTTRKKTRVRIQGRVRGSHAFSEKEKKLYEKYLEKAEKYQKSGDQAKSFEEKEKQYLMALKELGRMKKKRPKFIGSKRGIIAQIAETLIKISTLQINLGDTRQALIKTLGKPEKERDSIQFLPVGMVQELFFLDNGIMVSLYEDEIFAIDIKSGFQGTFYGIRMGDPFGKIKSLYIGNKIEIEGANFGYECPEWQMKFLFVDADDKVDSIKQRDKKAYEELTAHYGD